MEYASYPPRRAVRTSGATPTFFRPAGPSQTLSPWLNYEFESPPNTKLKPPPGAPTLLSALSGHQHLKMLDLRNNRLDGTAGSVIGRVRRRWRAPMAIAGMRVASGWSALRAAEKEAVAAGACCESSGRVVSCRVVWCCVV